MTVHDGFLEKRDTNPFTMDLSRMGSMRLLGEKIVNSEKSGSEFPDMHIFLDFLKINYDNIISFVNILNFTYNLHWRIFLSIKFINIHTKG